MGATLRFAVRGFLRTPGFTITALLTVALCLGASVTIFSVIDSVLLRGLPFPESDRLVTMYNSYPNAGVLRDGANPANYYERRGAAMLPFSHLALYREESAIVGEAGATERDDVVRITPDFFLTLGVQPRLGRSFRHEEMDRGNDDVVVLTDAIWRQRFNADPGVIGRTLRVDGRPLTVVGVLPSDFRLLSSSARLFLPYATVPAQRTPEARHSGSNSQMIARLRPGATLAQARAAVAAHDDLLAPQSPEAELIRTAGFRSVIVPLHADHVAAIRPTLLLLQGGVLVLVLIGAVNLVNLLLIRASGRARELAIRQSMGAGRADVVRQVFLETLTLTVVGGGLGLALAVAATRTLGAVGIDQLPLGATVTLGMRAALFAVAAVLALTALIALPIAWFNLRGQVAVSLRSESRGGTANRSAQRLRHAFIVAQVSLAFVLLSGAGLLVVSLDRALAVSPGFRADHLLTAQLSLPRATYPNRASLLAFADRLLEGVRREPGVAAVGTITNLPLSGNNVVTATMVRGHVPRPGESLQGHFVYGVAGDYFSAIGVPLREGRLPTGDELRSGARVAVVDEDFARRYWPNGSAVGGQLFEGTLARPDSQAMTIVGVVGVVKQVAVTDETAQGAVYLPFVHHADASFAVVTRTAHKASSFAPSLLRIVRRLDPELPVDALLPMEARIADSLVARRAPALLAVLFAVAALLLAAIGTYGVLSFAVAQRRREIGVRLALGAQPRQVGRQFLTLGLALLAGGTAIGVLGSWMSGRLMQRLLFQVPAVHLPTLLASALTMTVVVLAACLLPARRAARVDPLIAMGSD